MGDVLIPPKAILFCGILFTEDFSIDYIADVLSKYFGEIVLESQIFIFNETDYYKKEMGESIKRIFFGFDNLIDMDRIVEYKLESNMIENSYFMISGNRKVNIDPGYLTQAKVVLATTKNFQHRIYIKNGIYAEVTLRWRRGSFREWEWTYRDYKRRESVDFFNQLRKIYKMKVGNFI